MMVPTDGDAAMRMRRRTTDENTNVVCARFTAELRAARRRAEALRACISVELERRRASARVEDARRDAETEKRRRRVEDAYKVVEGLKEKVHDARANLEDEMTACDARERVLCEARAALRDAERAAFEVEVPCALAEAEADLRALREVRDEHQRRVMRQLRALIPVRLDEDYLPLGGRPLGIRACESRVPDVGDDVGFDARELAAGLGALMHFTALASRYLDAPRLHRGSHAGSQSFVWAPTSAWDDAVASVWENAGSVHVRDFAGPNAERLPLFLPRSITDGAAAGGTGSNVRSSGPGASGNAATDPSSAYVRDCRRALVRAIRLLARSASATCAYQARECGVVPPKDWGPFAQLCALTAHVARGEDDRRRRSNTPAPAPPARVLRNSTNSIVVERRSSPEILEAAIMMQSVADGHGYGYGYYNAAHTEIAESSTSSSIVEISRGKWLSESRRERDVLAFEDDAALVDFVDDASFFNETTEDGVDAWEAIHPNARGQNHRGTSGAIKSSSRCSKPPTGAAGRRVVLPPPPSASEDVEQWERAMLVDNQRQHAR
jgi:hypothetical protein